jgi:hypothetical protein
MSILTSCSTTSHGSSGKIHATRRNETSKQISSRQLNEKKIPSTGRGRWRHEDREWTNGTIRVILENPAYYGARSYNRNSNSKIVAQRNERQMTPGVRYPHWRNNRTDWVTIENAHPAIISKETWEQANRRSQATILSKPKHDVPYLLTGLIRCGNCGSPFQGHSTKKKDRYYYRYICGGFNAKRICTYCSIKRELLEDFVLNSIREPCASQKLLIASRRNSLWF